MSTLPQVTHNHPKASENREVRFGVEIEIPFRPPGAKPLVSMGEASDTEVHDGVMLSHPHGGEITHEWIGGPMVDGREDGLEARTPDGGIPYYDLANWYRESIEEIQEITQRNLEPTGFFGDTTAGLHTHISPMTEDQAQRLWEVSQEPFMQVFCGTSIAGRDANGNDIGNYPVVRSGWKARHLKIDDFARGHDSVVNKHRKGGTGHYEWRLPEPTLPDHFDMIVEFLVRFMDDADDGIEWARSRVQEGDRRIVSFQRADALDKDITASPDHHTTVATAALLDYL